MKKKNLYYNILRIIFNKENYYKIEIENIFKKDYKFEINNYSYNFKLDEIKIIDVSSLFLNIIISFEEEKILLKEDIILPDSKGFSKDSLLETKKGPKKISDIVSGDKILNKDGKDIIVEYVYLFKFEKENNNYPIIILKSNCGINLPYQDLIMSIKMNLKVRKVNLKGRNLYLNRKAKIYKIDESFYFYLIETSNKEDYLINGFITESA